MSPFIKNLQKFLIFFFTAIPVILIAVGIMRTKKNELVVVVPPDLGQPQDAPSTQDQNTQTQQPVAPTQATAKSSVTVTGKTYQTPYGSVSASITVAGSKITAVSMPQVPNSPPSIYAEPYLIQQALTAGSANIQGVSGATYTSLAFKSSLESAIVQAKAQGQTVAPTTTNTSTVSSPATPSVPRRYRDDDDD